MPAATDAPPAETPMSTWLKVTACVPKVLDRRTRAACPPARLQTMSRMVWSVNPAEEKSSAAARLGGVAAIGLAAHVDIHLAPPPAAAAAPAAGSNKTPRRTADVTAAETANRPWNLVAITVSFRTHCLPCRSP